ncbi:MAG: ABC transporter permease [Roseiflexaceae bacterium]
MKRAFTLAWQYLRLAFMNEMQYRINFFIQLFESALALGTALIVLALVYAQTDILNGWSRYELQALQGIYVILMGVVQISVQPNVERLLTDIQQGTFDFVLVKPIDSQLLSSIREVRIWQSVDIWAGSAVLGHALWQLGNQLGVVQVGLFVVAVLSGVLIIYALVFLLSTLAFWVIRIESIFEVFIGIMAAGRLPTDIYPRWLQIILVYLVPMAFAVTVPAQIITNRGDGTTLLIQLGVAALFMLITRLVWRKAVTRYSGASA